MSNDFTNISVREDGGQRTRLPSYFDTLESNLQWWKVCRIHEGTVLIYLQTFSMCKKKYIHATVSTVIMSYISALTKLLQN